MNFVLFGNDAASTGRGLWRSSDGETWVKCAATGKGWTDAQWGSVKGGIAHTSDGTTTAIFLVYSNALYRSLDDGENFATVTVTGAGNVLSVACDPTTPGRVCVVGATKPAISTSGLESAMTFTAGTAFSPGSTNPTLYADRHGRFYYFGTSGVWMTGTGLLWQKIRHQSTFTGAAMTGLFFQPLAQGDAAPMWAKTATGIFRGVMDGTAWSGIVDGETQGDPDGGVAPTGTPTNYRPAALPVYGVAFSDSYMLVCGNVAGACIYKAPIAEAQAGQGAPNFVVATVTAGKAFAHLYVDPVTPSSVYASAYGAAVTYEGIWRSADSGVNWAASGAACSTGGTSDATQLMTVGLVIPSAPVVANTPSLGKYIYPDTVTPGEVARLVIALVNPNPWPMTLTSDLVDTLPSGLVVAATPDAQTTCGNATLTATKGASTITLSSGATVPAASTRTVSVNVVSATAGYRLNTLAIGALVTNFGSNAAAVSCTLAVIPAPSNPPTVSKRFEPNVIVAGGTSRLIITFVNPNTSVAALNSAFTDTLPSGVLIASTPNAVIERATGTLSTGADTLTLGADGELPIGAGVSHLLRNARISVDVTAAAAGVYVDTTQIGDLNTDIAPVGTNTGAASATLTVMAAPYIETDGHFTLCFDVANKAWHHWDEPRTQGHYFDTVQKIMRAWGGLTCGHVHQRGGSVAPAVYFALAGMENPDRLKRFRHVELDLTGDVADWTCEFYIDGASAGTVTKAVPNRGWWRYGVAIASYIAAYGTSITTGQYGPPRRQTLRFPCPTGGRGRVMGFILRSALHAGFLRIHAVTPNTAEV